MPMTSGVVAEISSPMNLSALQLPMTLLRTAAYVNLICRFTCNAGANDVVADGGR